MNKKKELLEKMGLYWPLSILKWSLKDIPLILLCYIFRIFPIDRNKIVFSSFYGAQYNAQPKCISDYLINTHPSSIKIVWILDSKIQCCNEIKVVRSRSIKSIYELMTACAWVDNCRKPYWIKKKKKQLYIQTWHGPVCLKAVERDAKETLLPYYIQSAIQDSVNADYIVAECEWRKKNIINSFWYSGPIIEGQFKELGISADEEAIARVREFYNLSYDVKLVVYLPTFRKDGSVHNYLLDYSSLLNALNEKKAGNWKVIVRLHPNVAKKANCVEYNDMVLDGTQYPNSNDLISTADYVITDYSGCIFDGFIAKKKVILYAQDYDEYIKNDRDIYFPLDKLPSPLAKNPAELIAIINEFDETVYEEKRDNFIKQLGFYCSEAADQCGEIIINHIHGGK